MAKRRKKTNLGSGRIYHAKGARAAYRYASSGFDNTIKAAKDGRCRKALEYFTVANSDFGDFFTELKHAVGTGPARPYRGPMAAPRMKQALGNKQMDALETLSKRCLVK